MLFRWWRHKQLDDDAPGREATEIRSSVDETSAFLIFDIEYLQGTHQGMTIRWL